jgi:hypothetical protein
LKIKKLSKNIRKSRKIKLKNNKKQSNKEKHNQKNKKIINHLISPQFKLKVKQQTPFIIDFMPTIKPYPIPIFPKQTDTGFLYHFNSLSPTI